MFNVVIAEKGGGSRTEAYDKNEVNIGRVQGNDIVLAKGNVSKHHSRIVFKDGKFIVLDLRSTNGTYVNGKRISAPQVVKPSDKIFIGDYILSVNASEDAGEEEAPPEEEEAPPEEEEQQEEEAPPEEEEYEEEEPPPEEEEEAPPEEEEEEPPPRRGANRPAPLANRPAPMPVRAAPKDDGKPKRNIMKARDSGRKLDPKVVRYNQLQKEIHDRLIEYMDLRRLDIDKLGDEELWTRTEKSIRDILDQMEVDGELDEEVDREQLVTDVLNEALGLGPLEAFLADDDISEIMVNHSMQIYIEKKGKLTLSERTFSSNQAVLGVIERIVAPIGRRIDESSPLVDARLKDGSRVNAIIPPLSLKGPCITIRKFKREKLKIEDLIRYKTVTPQMAEFLEMCVKARKNIVISGGTGSGKTTTLNIVSNFIPEDERIVTVEDAAELQLCQDHWIQLESRPPNLEGKGQITIRDLVKNCLRMRPDRIVVGECRSGETLDMLQAMNTGHDGSLTTLHANTPRDAIARMETMVMMSGMELPLKAIRDQIASAVNIIVQQTRFSDGSRKIAYITEISGMEVDVVTMQDIFNFKQEGFDENNKVRGRFLATGFVPKFYDELQRRGIPVNMNIFREE
ncbi:MAG: ATPase, T2SS/T4P/T4SS family [Myxococcales bacterium]